MGLAIAIGELEIMMVFRTSGIGTIAQGGRIERSVPLFAREKEPTDCFAGG